MEFREFTQIFVNRYEFGLEISKKKYICSYWFWRHQVAPIILIQIIISSSEDRGTFVKIIFRSCFLMKHETNPKFWKKKKSIERINLISPCQMLSNAGPEHFIWLTKNVQNLKNWFCKNVQFFEIERFSKFVN